MNELVLAHIQTPLGIATINGDKNGIVKELGFYTRHIQNLGLKPININS